MDFTGEDFWVRIFTGPEFATWMRICVWGFLALWAWVFFSLSRGGFEDLFEVARSRYATPRERFDTLSKIPLRVMAHVAASAVGAGGFALGLFVQGAIIILIWREINGG
ncbi:MAG: hypothetical protein ABL308_10845 [Oceanicaulis sp.]